MWHISPLEGMMIGYTGVSCRLAGIQIFDLKFRLYGTNFSKFVNNDLKFQKILKENSRYRKDLLYNIQNLL
jgi:hypothetical protein